MDALTKIQELIKTYALKNKGIFYQSSEDTLTWEELLSFERLTFHSAESFEHFHLISSENCKHMLLSLLASWHQQKSALVLDNKIQPDKRNQILSLAKQYLPKTDAPTLYLLSSGSSGELKILGLSLDAIINSAQMTMDFYSDQKISHWGLDLPVHHIGGMMILWRMLLSGGRVSHFPLEKLCQLSDGPHAVSLVPTQLQKALQHSQQITALKKLKLILLGGAACSQDLLNSILSHQLPVSLTYGATETCSQVFATKPFAPHGQTLNVGTALSGVELISPVPHQGPALISLKSSTLFHLLITKDGCQHLAPDRIFQTNDLGEIDQSGQLMIKGRADHIFISGGENISPEEIENRLRSCPGLEELLLVPRHDKTFGQVGHLFYHGHDNNLRARLQDEIKKKLLPYERPKSLSLMPESLRAGLKIQRSLARELIESWEKNTDQTPILFLHGLMGHAYDFDHLIEELISQGVAPWRCIALTLPGHDKSPLPANAVDFSSYLDSVSDKYQKYWQEDFYLYGYSLGARIAFQLLLRKNIQQHCRLLFCEGGHFGLDSQDLKDQRLKADKELFSLDADEKSFSLFLESWHQMELFKNLKESPLFAEHLERKKSRHNLPDLYQTLVLTSTGAQHTRTLDLRALPFKPIYFTGDWDQKYSEYGQDLDSQGLVTHLRIEQASHNIHLMRPQALAKEMIAILNT